GQASAIAAESQGITVGWTAEQLPAHLRIPQTHDAIPADTGQQLAARMEGRLRHRILVADQDLYGPLKRRFPPGHVVVKGSAGESPSVLAPGQSEQKCRRAQVM